MRPEGRPGFDLAPPLIVIAAAGLGGVLQWTNGHYKPGAVLVVVAIWLLTLFATLGSVRLSARFFEARAIVLVLALALAVQLGLLVTEPPAMEMEGADAGQRHLFDFLVVVASLLVGLGVAGSEPLRTAPGEKRSRWSGLWFPALVVVHFVMGGLVIGFVREPSIDVYVVEMDSARALLHGINPFGITFPDPYHGTSAYFPPGTSVDGRLMFGFVYPPLSLLLCLPGYILGGDTRWSMLVALELAALLIAHARPGKLAKLAAAAFLFMPRTFFVLSNAWTDSFVVLLTAAVCFSAMRKPRWLFVALGLYVCLKQHMFLGIPALLMLLPRPLPWKQVGALTWKGGAVAAAVTIPFVLWGPHAFFHSVIDIREMFRLDSLGVLAYLHNTGLATPSKWTGLAAVIPLLALGLWRVPRTPGGFALFAGATHFTLYLFSTHAFCNEYFNVIGALYCAVGLWGPVEARALEAA